MPTTAGKPYAEGLNKTQFAQARKDMLLKGSVSVEVWDKADSRQRDILHHIELTIMSVSEDELKTILF